mgnify:CR=1 FL=1
MSQDEKFDVYEYQPKQGSSTLFSKWVTRDFGENRVVFAGGHQIIASVMPLHDSNGLKKIGYMVKGANQ